MSSATFTTPIFITTAELAPDARLSTLLDRLTKILPTTNSTSTQRRVALNSLLSTMEGFVISNDLVVLPDGESPFFISRINVANVMQVLDRWSDLQQSYENFIAQSKEVFGIIKFRKHQVSTVMLPALLLISKVIRNALTRLKTERM
jgi:hypothetical protein